MMVRTPLVSAKPGEDHQSNAALLSLSSLSEAQLQVPYLQLEAPSPAQRGGMMENGVRGGEFQAQLPKPTSLVPRQLTRPRANFARPLDSEKPRQPEPERARLPAWPKPPQPLVA